MQVLEKSYLSVAQVNTYIKKIFEAEVLLQNISVYGEISSYNVSNGIAYFNLKDQNNLLSCVLFGASKFVAPKLGDLVLIRGSVSYYAKGGRLSFQANHIEPYGKGKLYEEFLELKNKLETLGYFELDRKKPIPKRVKKIGVVTSATGAVIQDIIDVATRRNNGVNIVLYPVKVQGVGAEFEIAKGIKFFDDYPDVDCVIVARGGGSLEDLQPFNTEVVANATFASKKPLVSAVGHETDYTIIDFVSDLRAPTPSAAAELVVNSKLEDIQFIENQIAHIEKSLANTTKQYEYNILTQTTKMEHVLQKNLQTNKNWILQLLDKLYYQTVQIVERANNKVLLLQNTINNKNPNLLLQKGYTKIEFDGKTVKQTSQLKQNDEILFRLQDGTVHSVVKNIKKEV